MFGSSVEEELKEALERSKAKVQSLQTELNKNQDELRAQKDLNRDLEWKVKILGQEAELDHQRKVNELRASMQESLIKSDLLRVEALAKLETYEKTDTKADANTIKEMLSKLIDNGKQQPTNISVIK